MKTKSQFLTVILFVTSLIMATAFSSMFILWLRLEVNMIAFIIAMSVFKDDKDYQNIHRNQIYYFCLQTIGSAVIVFFLATNFGDTAHALRFILLAMLLKIGAFPFHFWTFKLSRTLRLINLLIFLTIQKIPLMFLMIIAIGAGVWKFFLISSIGGLIMLFYRNRIKHLIISSSIYSLMWLRLIYFQRVRLLFTLYANYIFFLRVLLRSEKEPLLRKSLGVLFFGGLPPMRLFFIKVMFLSSTVIIDRDLAAFVIWGAAFLSFVAYMNFFISTYFWLPPYYQSKISNAKTTFLIIRIMSMWLFV